MCAIKLVKGNRRAIPLVCMILLLVGFPLSSCQAASTVAPATERALADNAFLEMLARDTWLYLGSDWATDNHLPWSWRSRAPLLTGGDYANPAEIGLFMLSYISAYELQRAWSPPWPVVEVEIGAILDQLRAWQTGSQSYQPHGPNAYQNSVFLQDYWINWNPPVVGANPRDQEVPSVDNAWLAASLITIREYAEAKGRTALAQKADAILGDMNFMLWYHPETHRFRWKLPDGPQGPWLADDYSSENRIINFVARALGQLSAAEYHASLKALVQVHAVYERGAFGPTDDITVARDNWDGSYFTYSAPALFMREMQTIYGTDTINKATEAQIAYASDKGYPVWGISDAFNVGDSFYVERGVSPRRSCDPQDDKEDGLITPHASALALGTVYTQAAMVNLQKLRDLYPDLYDAEYGFKDSVNVNSQRVSARFSALGQEWLFLSLINHLNNGFINQYFYRDVGVQQTDTEMAEYLAEDTSPPQFSCNSGPARPPTAITHDLDAGAADWGVFSEGATAWIKENVAAPSIDGKALRCALMGTMPYSNVHCYRNMLPDSLANSFTMTMTFMFTPTTTWNNQGGPSTVQALEFTMSQWHNAYRYEFAVQWENVGSGAPQWRYWNSQPGPGRWVSLDPAITQQLEAGQWYTLTLQGEISNGMAQFQQFSVGNQLHPLGLTMAPASAPGELDRLAVAVQLDGNSTQTPYSVYLDKVDLDAYGGSRKDQKAFIPLVFR
ncbi:MAG: hypothetical protein EXR62_04290 [Chloroflexi bacterium]|nr:hypothetical protein [Chloroflexota bacterium]